MTDQEIRSCQPPVADTKTPNRELPKNACDAHCHVFGPSGVFPYHANRSYTPPDAPKEKLRKLHSTLGLERAVIVQATCYDDDNSAMLDAIAHANGRYKGVAMVADEITDKELLNLHDGGVRGARFSYARHLGSEPDFSKVIRLSEKFAPLGWHAVLYLEAQDVVDNVKALGSLPVPVVIDHMARVKVAEGVQQKSFQLLLDFVRNEDFWIKISCAERLSVTGAPFDDVVPFAQAVIEAAPDRILWGTDWPHPNIHGVMPNDGDLVNLLEKYAPNRTTREKILVDNPARLYGWNG